MNKVLFLLLVVNIAFRAGFSQRCSANAAVYEFKFGEWEATVISDGDLVFQDPQGNFRAPAIAVKRSFENLFLPTSPFLVPQNAIVLSRGRDRILVDTGMGSDRTFGDAGKLVKNMRAAGISPQSITHIILTHGHIDHVGGIANPDGSAVFPNAKLYISRLENDFFNLPFATFVKLLSEFPTPLIKLLIDTYKKSIAAYRGKIVLVGKNDVITPGIRVFSTPGHTPGHSAVRVWSKGKRFYIVGDAFAGRAGSVQNPDWNLKSDANTEVAVKTRFRLLDNLARGKHLTLMYHEMFPGVGYIVPKGAFYDFVPAIPQLGAGVRKIC